MTDDDEQRVDRIERAVLRRLDRRRAARTAVLRGATAAVLLVAAVGGLAALHPSLTGSGSAGSSTASRSEAVSADSNEGTAAGGTPASVPAPAVSNGSTMSASSMAPSGALVAVRCHATSARNSATMVVRPANQPAAIATACADAFQRAVVPIVLCQSSYRGDDLVAHPAEGYPADAHPATLCARNGLKPIG